MIYTRSNSNELIPRCVCVCVSSLHEIKLRKRLNSPSDQSITFVHKYLFVNKSIPMRLIYSKLDFDPLIEAIKLKVP